MRYLFLSVLLAATVVPLPESGVVAQVRETSERMLPGQLPRRTRAGGILFRCLFDRSADAEDGDAWPDFWTRKQGIDQGVAFPYHQDIRIVEHRNTFGNFALRMNIEGGGAGAFSPKIPIREGMSYTVSAYVDTEGFVHDEAFILLVFYGEAAAPLRTVASERVRETGGWRRLDIGPVAADIPGAKWISVGLLVVPTERQDFGVRADFTNIEIRESTTVSLSVDSEHHLVFDPREIDVRCLLEGFDPDQHTVLFSLEDPYQRVVMRREVDILIGNDPASRFVANDRDPAAVYRGEALWRGLPIASPGFYRVRVSTPESYVQALKLPQGVYFRDPLLDTVPLNLVVLEPGSFVPDGEFGWNLDGWSLDDIAERRSLLRQSGLSRIKLPAWFSQDAEKTEHAKLRALCDELARARVQMVGLLRPVPQEVRDRIKLAPVNAASLFSLGPATWSETLRPTLEELSLLIRDWQWTADDDLTLAELPGFLEHFAGFRRAFDRNDFGFGVGLAWNWARDLPERFGERAPEEKQAAETGNGGVADSNRSPTSPVPRTIPRPVNEFVSLTSTRPLTADELERYLAGTASSRIRRFVSLVPLSSSEYELEDRVVDLVRRMVIGKAGGAEALFLSRPIDSRTGVLRADITPTELFPPWRTTSALLSGRRFLGSVVLPGGSRNYHFDAGGGSAVMVLWNDRATRDHPVFETLYLGAAPEVHDVWGRRFTPETLGREQRIPVGSIPVFVTGLQSEILRWRLGFRLERREIPSLPDRPNTISFSFANNTPQPVSAQITVSGPRPDDWKTEPAVQTIALDGGASADGRFDLTLTRRANTGRQPIRFNVKTTGATPHEFSIYDYLWIGERDVSMEFSSRLLPNGDIEVTQSFVNDGEKTYTYSCRLYVPDRAFLQSYVTRQGFGRSDHVYTIRRGKELLDRGVRDMTVRARPLGAGQPMVYTVPLLPD